MQTVNFDATSRLVDTGDITLHVNDVGEGPAVVMLHGAGPGATSWSNFKQNVPELSRHFRLLLVDQPGFGLSDKPTFADRSILETTSRAIAGLLDSLDLDSVHIVGNSMGGANALRFTLDHPERVDRLLLMGPGGASVNLTSPPVSPPLAGLYAFYEADRPERAGVEAFLRSMVFDKRLITDELIEERWEVAAQKDNFEGQRQVSRSLASLPEHDQLWRHLQKVRHPVLMTWGRDDQVLPLDNAFFALRRLGNARLHVFPKCGHWAQLEKRHEFDGLATGFFKGEL